MTECKLIGTRVVEIIPSREMVLEYFILEDTDEMNHGISYGVEIRKAESKQVEYETIKGITESKSLIEHLVDLLVEHTVTPITLVEVVDDFITEKVCS